MSTAVFVLLAIAVWTMVIRKSWPAAARAWQAREWPDLMALAWVPVALLISAYMIEHLPTM